MSTLGQGKSHAAPALRLVKMTKTFNGVLVLNGVSIDISPGEIHGLVGENGSGKSTLVKTLGGVHAPDEGSVCELHGISMQFPIRRPQEHGIAIIHQDLALCDEMNVAENIGISNGFDAKSLGLYRRSRERGIVHRLSAGFGLPLDPDMPVGSLDPAERSVVAILRALRSLRQHGRGGVVVLDEPTAALPHAESERLLAILRNLAGAGAAVLFISHRLREVLSVCDRISVLRNGELVDTVRVSDVDSSTLVSMMLGYDIGAFYPAKRAREIGGEVLSVAGVCGHGIDDLSLGIGHGEIAGITGLAGMGQDTIPYLINGHFRRVRGEVRVCGSLVGPSPRDSLRSGLVLVPASRPRDAVWTTGSAAENLTLPFLHRFSRGGVLRHGTERRFAHDEMKHFDVRPLRPAQQIGRFSGGNQQKIVLARALQIRPRVLLLHEPTQGVDAGAKKEIFNLIRQCAEQGTAVGVFSSDTEEIANTCHRVLIMRHGLIVSELADSEVTEDNVILASQAVVARQEES